MAELDETKSILNYSSLINKNKILIKKSEKFAILIFAVGLLLWYLEIERVNFILLIGTVFLTIIYFLFSLMTLEFDEQDNLNSNKSIVLIIFFYKLSFLGAAIAVISFLGLIININNPSTVLLVGGFNLFIPLVGTLFLRSKNAIRAFNGVYFLRIIILIALLVVLSIFKYNLL